METLFLPVPYSEITVLTYVLQYSASTQESMERPSCSAAASQTSCRSTSSFGTGFDTSCMNPSMSYTPR